MSVLSLKRPCVKRVERRKPETRREGASPARPFGPDGRVLAICDVENIWISARRRGLSICFTRFHDHLKRELGATHLHAVCTNAPNGCLPIAELKASPWDLHTREVSWIRRDGKWIRQANSDTLFAALAGSMVSRLAPQGLILLTGDGALACDTARIIRTTAPAPPRIIAMGIEGTVSRRLLRQNPAEITFGGNLIASEFVKTRKKR